MDLTRQEDRARLLAGPWFWPDHQDAEALCVAREASGRDGPPEPRAGATLLTAVSDTAVSLWALEAGDPGAGVPCEGGLTVASLSPETLGLWRTAGFVLPNALPLFWASVRDVRERAPRARLLLLGALPGRQASLTPVLRGESFGLSFVLSQASIVLRVPLPLDLAASARIDRQGNVLPVGRLDLKLRAAVLVPRLRRYLVAASQVQEAERAGSRLEIVGVSSAAEALAAALPDLATYLSEAGSDPSRRSEIVESFFDLALRPRAHAVAFAPVARAAELALEWPGLTGEERSRLSFAANVAWRHAKNAGSATLPSPEWIDALPQPLRLDYVRNLVQQSADTGEPEPRQVAAIAGRYLVRGNDAFLEHIKLLGACGRLHASMGRHRDALAFQAEAVQEWLRRKELRELSYPLSECFRLAGALLCRAAFDQAEIWLARAEAFVGDEGLPYVLGSRGRALAAFGLPEAEPGLVRLLDGVEVPPDVRQSAARTLANIAAQRGQKPQHEAMCDAIVRIGGDQARVYLALVRLDAALSGGESLAQAALEEVLEAEPKLGAVLARSHRASDFGDLSLPRYVARFYPY